MAVPSEDLDAVGLVAGGIKSLTRPTTGERVDGDHAQRTIQGAMPPAYRLSNPHSVAATVHVQSASLHLTVEHLSRGRQALSPFARAAVGSRLALRPWCIESCIQVQAARQIAVARQILQYALPAVGGVGHHVKSPVFPVVAENLKHLDGQLRPRSGDPSSPLGRLVVEVQPK